MFKIIKLLFLILSFFLITACDYECQKKFYPMPMGNGLVSVIPFYDKSMRCLKKTGQKKSYNTNGEEVTDNSIKDDGSYKKGISHSYKRNNSVKVVLDYVTELLWQDNETVQKPWITQENYDAGDYYNTSGDTATTYCSNLNLGGFNDWRLPTKVELETLFDYTFRYPVMSPKFIHVGSFGSSYQSSIYWTSTLWRGILAYQSAKTVDFNFVGTDSRHKTATHFVRCVRLGHKYESDFTRDTNTFTVTDNKTKLIWQDDINAKTIRRTWAGAIDYCENLTLAGSNSWRLPNANELSSIVDDNNNPAIHSSFKNFHSVYHYWTSTTYIYKTYASYVSFSTGTQGGIQKNGVHQVRCVKSID